MGLVASCQNVHNLWWRFFNLSSMNLNCSAIGLSVPPTFLNRAVLRATWNRSLNRVLGPDLLPSLLRNRPRKDYAGLVSHAAHREAGRRGTSVPIQIAVRCVIGVLVAPVAIAATKPKRRPR